jgi:hypothetical protein
MPPPMGLVLKQLVPSASTAETFLWVLGLNLSNQPTAFILNPLTLAVITTIPLPAPFNLAFHGIVWDGTYVWVGARDSASSSSILQYTPSGTHLSTTAFALNGGSDIDINSLCWDGVSTIYGIGAGGISAINTGTLVSSPISATTGFVYGAWDPIDSQLGLDSGVNTDVYSLTVPGLALSTISVAPGGNAIFVAEGAVSGADFFWFTGYNNFSSATEQTIFKVAGSGFAVTTITPPAPAPPVTTPSPISSGVIGNIKFNIAQDTVYVIYPYADSTRDFARIDAIVPSTNAITTLVNTLPTNNFASLWYIETKGSLLWTSDTNQTMTLLSLPGGSVLQQVVLSGAGGLGEMAYTG